MVMGMHYAERAVPPGGDHWRRVWGTVCGEGITACACTRYHPGPSRDFRDWPSGLAAVAMQQGRYVGGLISQRLREKDLRPFRYYHKGNLAIIGRHAGVADSGRLHLHGFLAWIL